MSRPHQALALLILSVPLIAAAAPQQRDTPPPPTPAPATGRIAGTVVGAETGRPVRFAKVALTSSRPTIEVLTDEAGGFSFDRLNEGTYTLEVTKPGYLDTAYGQTRPGTDTRGTPIRLRDREQIVRLVVPLSHGGSISGTVRDDRGEPVYRARVRVLRWVMRNGVRVLDEVDSTETDERGLYRFSLLPPRQYLISAAASDDAIPRSKSEGKPEAIAFGFTPMFYPSTTQADGAAPMSLGVGEDRPGVDFQLPLVRLGRISGVVIGADGKPAAGVSVTLVDATGSSEFTGQGTRTKADGRFTFDRVVPGAYVVKAGGSSGFQKVSLNGRLRLEGADISFERLSYSVELLETKASLGKLYATTGHVEAMSSPAASAGTASADVSAASGTVSDITLMLEPPREVSGRVVFDGQSQRPSAGTKATITLRAATESGDTLKATITENGTFVMPNVAPGKYVVSLNGAPSPWGLASAVAAGVETLDRLLEVPRDRDVRDLTLTLTDRGTELTGTVTDGMSQPVGDRTVVVFPTDERLWSAGAHRIRAETLGDDGRYAFKRLPPGSYRLAVVDGVEPDEWLDPLVLRQFVAGSILLSIGDGERKVQDVRTGGR